MQGYLNRPEETLAAILEKESPHDQLGLTSLRAIHCSGAPLDAAVRQRMGRKLRIDIQQAYGVTETSPIITVSPLSRAHNGVSSVGMVVPNATLQLLDESACTVAAGEPGELYIRGPQVSLAPILAIK